MDRLAIVILNYNGQKFLQQFLPSVIQHADDHPVYVVDNASTDGSVSFLKTHFTTVRVVELSQNTGYAGGYNESLRVIRQDYGGATYYALVNSDIEPTPNWISPILQLMDRHPRIAACQPKIRDYSRRNYFEHAGAAGGFIDYLGYVFCRGRVFATFETDHGQYDDSRRVFWATGACLVVRADIFHQSGGFDAHFFAHMEEIDWCWRIQRLGHEAWVCGASVVYHVGGGTLPKVNPHKTYLNYRNSLYMLYKNLPSRWLWPKIMYRLVLDGLSSVLFLKQGQFSDVWAIIRAHFAFYGHLPTLRQQRRQLKPQQELTELPVLQQSIVWQYFGKGKKTFGEMDNEQ